ncbi:MAG TPA: kelch repeat-containing protein [Gaiellaceae bacterium]|nr:kelch repeat-containing protein [Gaiellaceae bacterium]
MIALVAAAALAWSTAPPLPEPRTEVAAAAVRGEIAIVGGLAASGDASARVDAYSPATNRWRQLPDLPIAVHHALAASDGTRLYVVGGYGGPLGIGRPVRDAFVLESGRWQRLPRLPEPRAAGGAAVLRGRLYAVGGVAAAGLARRAFALDLRTRRWSEIPAPTPRQHLAVTAAAGKIYAVAGRVSGLGTNMTTLEAWSPGARRWTRLPPVPQPRGGTGAAAVGGTIVSVGGEAPAGTVRSVFAYSVATRRWRRLPDLPTSRHGLGVAAAGTRVYAIGGGPRPGLTISDANEYLDLA